MHGVGSHRTRRGIEVKDYERELGQKTRGAYKRTTEKLYALANRDGGYASLAEYMDLSH